MDLVLIIVICILGSVVVIGSVYYIMYRRRKFKADQSILNEKTSSSEGISSSESVPSNEIVSSSESVSSNESPSSIISDEVSQRAQQLMDKQPLTDWDISIDKTIEIGDISIDCKARINSTEVTFSVDSNGFFNQTDNFINQHNVKEHKIKDYYYSIFKDVYIMMNARGSSHSFCIFDDNDISKELRIVKGIACGQQYMLQIPCLPHFIDKHNSTRYVTRDENQLHRDPSEGIMLSFDKESKIAYLYYKEEKENVSFYFGMLGDKITRFNYRNPESPNHEVMINDKKYHIKSPNVLELVE
jgi:hypothetical protein